MCENNQNTPNMAIEFSEMDENFRATTPKPTTSKGAHEEEFIHQLVGKLKERISQAVDEVKQRSKVFIESQAANNEVARVMPVSYHVSKDVDHNFLSMSKKKRQKAVVVGEIQTSFEIPIDYPLDCSELGKLPMLPQLQEQMESGIEHDVGLRFLERLKGWKLQCRQGRTGRLDTYYHHIKSNEAFRSKIEVVNFILYDEICPRHLIKKPTTASNKKFKGPSGDERETSLCSPSSRENSTDEAEAKAIKESYTEVPTALSEAMFEDSFLSKKKRGKRKRREDSSAMTSRRVDKCEAPTLDLVTSPPVDTITDVNVEGQDKAVMILDLDTIPDPNLVPQPANPTTNPTGDPIFYQLGDLPKPPSYNPYEYDLESFWSF